jgi:hypothetical protein
VRLQQAPTPGSVVVKKYDPKAAAAIRYVEPVETTGV